MKKTFFFVLLLVTGCFVYAADVSDPQADEISRGQYNAGDTLKIARVDLNGDGVSDWLFTVVESNPEPTTVQAIAQDAGVVTWDAYVSNADGKTFKPCIGVEVNGSLLQSDSLQLNPDVMYAGYVSEIKRYGLVASTTRRAKDENHTIIYAYTYERDHFKQWKLADYSESQQNAIFSKYLTDAKRTHVIVQQLVMH